MTHTPPPPASRQRVLSGIQPTSDSFHLGNYLGAVRQWVALQDEFEAFYFIPNMHGITTAHDPKALRERTVFAVAQLLALGVDPERSTLFVQSQVPEHAELTWVLSCLTGFGEASRTGRSSRTSPPRTAPTPRRWTVHLPDPDGGRHPALPRRRVPVGEDQRQHLELTRTLAQRFNTRFKKTFVVPEAHIVAGTAKIYDLQNPTAKMSKSAESDAGLINLLDDPTVIAKRVRSAVTDTEREIRFDRAAKPGISNLLTIESALTGRGIDELEGKYAGKGYGELKSDVSDVLVEFTSPLRERVQAYLDDRAELDRILAAGPRPGTRGCRANSRGRV